MWMSLRLVTLALVLGLTHAGTVGVAPAQSTGIRGWIESLYNWGFGEAQTAAAILPEQRSVVYEEHTYIDMPSKGVTLVDHGFPIVTMCPVNVIFILDGSDSVSPQGFDEARAYLKGAIRNVTEMYEGTDVGVIMFSNGISEEIALRPRNQYELQQLYREIDNLVQPRRETELHTTLERARSLLASYAPSEGKVIVLISDGCPNNVALSQMQAKNAWSEGIYILSIAIEKAQLNMLKKLSVRIQNILTPIKWKYTLACPPSNLPQVPAGLGCSDVMIVMDGSDSACKHKDVIKNYLVNLPLRFNNVPNYMGVVVYGTDVDSVIPLTQNKQTLSNRIKTELRFPATGTATAKGIEEAIQNLQRSRTSSNQAMILITDGPPINAQLAAAATRRAINYGIKVVVVGVGNHLQNFELVALAGGKQENVYRVDSFLDLYSVDYTNNICGVPTNCNNRCVNGRRELVNDKCSCICKDGFSGNACDVPDVVCSTCINGGFRRSSNPNDCTCNCPAGFGGQYCQNDLCLSQRSSCNGNVSPTNGGCECVCRAGYTGNDCTVPVCDDNRDCSGNGRSFYDINQRTCRCQCQSEFTGLRCETKKIVCPPCRNGGNRQTTSTYDCRCTCPNGYSGEYCEVDECQSIQTSCNNGRLVRLSGGCRCECNPGITGSRCDTCITPCDNGGTPYISNGVCDCRCRSGFGGTRCSRSLCVDLNCDEGKVELVNDRCTCVCNPGFTGSTCSEPSCNDARDCNGNGRSFYITSNSTCGCNCNQGFLPPNCARRDCSRFRCANGGRQISNGLSCSCSCPPTHTGSNCDSPVCAICLNGGFNPSPNTGCTCQCRNGYSGNICEIDECQRIQQSRSCQNGRTVPTPNGCTCACNAGITGTNCDTRCLRETCSGRGQSRLLNDRCVCDCNPGFTGVDCNTPLCTAKDCSFQGTAFFNSVTNGCGCNCNAGFTGPRCENKVCDQCLNGGFRADPSNCGCTCRAGFTGPRCEVDECQLVRQRGSCANGRTVPTPNGCTCTCNAGITGPDCNVCINQCQNGGTSYISNGICLCRCPVGYSGNGCEIKPRCLSETCSGRGKSRLLNDRCVCDCDPGFTGNDCQSKLCTDSDCNFRGSAYFDLSTGRCACNCNTGFLAPDCQKRDCSRFVCQNGGQSADGTNGCYCRCPPTFSGTRCEIKDCSNSISCLNGGNPIARGTNCACNCQANYIGDRCETRDCRQYSCQNGGFGVANGNTCNCQCPNGFTGNRCETRDCRNSISCLNGGNPVARGVNCECNCPPNYIGTRCETRDCSNSISCLNGGNPIARGTNCACNCPANYIGDRCETRDCRQYSCQNGGFGVANGNTCNCQCPNGFTGNRCETRDCRNSISCLNGGNPVARGVNCECNCPPNYIGTRCEIRDCSQYACQNGGVGVANGNTCTCQCPQGYIGSRCETRDCRGTPCRNGGTSVVIGNRCGCQCPTGFSGLQCETRECFDYGCRNGGTPAVSGNNCYCRCREDYTGQFCDTPTCLNYRCDNGGSPFSTGSSCSCRCPSFFTGSRCESRVCNSLTQTCENGGTPVPSGNTCSCICANGFSGPNCGRSLCLDTCYNGGSPIATQSGCGCNCTPDFAGDQCTENRCDNYCVNGQPTSTFSRGCGCNCLPGYSGPQCNIRDPCFGIPCLNGNKVSRGGTCQCQCRPGFSGFDCSNPLCTRSNCNDHGQSVYNDRTGTCQCFCDAGFSGPTCALITTACGVRNSFCNYHGISTYNLDSGRCDVCKCDLGYDGLPCQPTTREGDILPAAPCRTDCINGVGRINGPGQCFCSCNSGYTGTFCETEITTEQCSGAENRCQNGQPSVRNTCTGECQCACGENYAGAYCEIKVEADICNNCHWENGVGFTYVKGRCDIFVTCIKNVDGGFLKVTSNCAPGTFWDMEKLTCVAVGTGICSEDPCQSLAPYANYSHGSQCQEFYTCSGDGRTEGMGCCEAGWGFNPQRQQCQPDSSCKGVCKRSPIDTRAASCYTGCEFAVNSTDNHWFYSKQNTDDRRMCGPGTFFNETMCICDHDLSPPSRQIGCDPDRFLHFDNGIFQTEFTYDNVTLLGASAVGGITNGAGRFDGNDRVLIQRFANSGFHYNYFIIQVRVKPDNILPRQEFAVISNGDCGVNESVSITLTPGQVHFKVQPEESSPSILSANINLDANGWVELELHYIKNENGGYTFFGVVDGSESNKVYLSAPIDSRKCAIQVGQGYGYQLLHGFVDWVKIYTLCDPNAQFRG